MYIENLTQSSKAVKIRKFDKETNSKVLIDAKWHLLGGNKQPYLSIDIRQVKANGEIIHGWEDQKETIKNLDKELYSLVNLHLTNLDGAGMHQTVNMKYHFNLAKEQFGKDIYTQEKHNKIMSGLWEEITGHELFNNLFVTHGESLHSYLKEYQNKNSAYYQYKDFDKSKSHWIKQIEKSIGVFKAEKLKPFIIDYFNKLEQYKNKQNEYKYKTLLSECGVYTHEKLADIYNLGKLEVLEILASVDSDELLDLISLEITANNLIVLEELTNKYEIPLVISK